MNGKIGEDRDADQERDRQSERENDREIGGHTDRQTHRDILCLLMYACMHVYVTMGDHMHVYIYTCMHLCQCICMYLWT